LGVADTYTTPGIAAPTTISDGLAMNLKKMRDAQEGEQLTDNDVRGLQLRVQLHRKTFYLYYRTKSGQRRRPKR
jgi:hypothetical protein